MVRSQIISKLSNREHQKLKKSDLKKILQIFLNTIVEGIKKNKSSEFRGFGTFSVKILKAKKNARNPRTGEKIHVKEKKSISFKMSRELSEKINKKRIIN
tara:strand:+ start:198 stop:497 length:300 start_codon:yes stop_codon:yes gene_type:complete